MCTVCSRPGAEPQDRESGGPAKSIASPAGPRFLGTILRCDSSSLAQNGR